MFVTVMLVGGVIFFAYSSKDSAKVAGVPATLTSFPSNTQAPTLTVPTITSTNVTISSPTATRGAVAPTITPPPTVRPLTTLAPTIAPVIVAVDDPNKSGTVDGLIHALPPKSATWYRFGYGADPNTGKRPIVTITLVNAKDSGVRFEVYAPENINNWWNNNPTGRGTVQMVDCATGEPSESGECQSHDLVWKGAFGAGGTYFVRVVNDNSVQSVYLLRME